MSGIRKHTRHCGRYGFSAQHIQVSYFRYTDTGKRRGKTRQRKHEAKEKQALL